MVKTDLFIHRLPVYDVVRDDKQAISLATGYIVYVNMVFAVLFAMALFVGCARKDEAARPTFWDCVIFSSGQ